MRMQWFAIVAMVLYSTMAAAEAGRLIDAYPINSYPGPLMICEYQTSSGGVAKLAVSSGQQCPPMIYRNDDVPPIETPRMILTMPAMGL